MLKVTCCLKETFHHRPFLNCSPTYHPRIFYCISAVSTIIIIWNIWVTSVNYFFFLSRCHTFFITNFNFFVLSGHLLLSTIRCYYDYKWSKCVRECTPECCFNIMIYQKAKSMIIIMMLMTTHDDEKGNSSNFYYSHETLFLIFLWWWAHFYFTIWIRDSPRCATQMMC